MTKTTRYCDQCSKAEGEGNHWLRVSVTSEAVTIALDLDHDEAWDVQWDACGDACAIAMASRLVGELRAARAKAA